MEAISQHALPVAALVGIHLLTFGRCYTQPYRYATSEPLDTAFPSSRLLGEALRHGRLVHDPYYYPHYECLPFLSTFYPPHMLQAWVGSFIGVDGAWRLYLATMAAHFLGCALGSYALLVVSGLPPLMSSFGAISCSLLPYGVKQNSTIIYTCAWVPVLILTAVGHYWGVYGISLGLMLLAGYWPIALYAIPVSWLAWLLGR